MIKDIQTASFFLKDGLNDNSEFRWCFCTGDEGFGDEGFGEMDDFDIGPQDIKDPDPEAAAAAGIGGGRGGDPRDYGFDPKEADRAALAEEAKEEMGRLGPLAGDETFGGFFDPETPEFSGWGKPDVPTTSQEALDVFGRIDPARAQELLDMRAISPNILGIPEMNILEKDYNLNTFGLGYRGAFEARSPKGLSRDEYDPNTLTGAGTDAASDNRALFASFARANPSLSTVEALSEYNATANPDQQVSISDVQNMGFELNAPVGPQADFREAEAQRGFGQGLGMIGRSLAFGPIGAMTDIALSGTGKGVLGHIGDMFEKASGYELPEVPDFGLPTIQGTVEDVVGPSKDTMAPASFGIGASYERSPDPYASAYGTLETEQRAQEIAEQAYDRTKAELSSPQMQSVMGPTAIETAALDAHYGALPSAREQAEREDAAATAEAFGLADISPPTNEEIGYTDMGLGSFTPDGNEFSQLPIPIQTQTAPVQEVQVAEKAAPRFPVRDTTPDSVIRTLAQIYKDDQGNPDEQRARELLGIGIA